jgi:hypothetical protein
MAPGIPPLNGKELFAAVLFIASVFILGLKLMNPTPLVIWYTGEDYIIQTERIGDIYSATDVIVLIVSSLVICEAACISCSMNRFIRFLLPRGQDCHPSRFRMRQSRSHRLKRGNGSGRRFFLR